MKEDQERVEDLLSPWGTKTGDHAGTSPVVGDEPLKSDPSDDDVIELVDVVREGGVPDRAGEDDLSLIEEQDRQGEEEAFESPDFDFEAPEAAEPAGEEAHEILDEDLDLVMAGLGEGEAEPGLEIRPSEPETQEAALPISQERLEAAIAAAITPVVERVVREAVAEAAERVIQEAIEGLRKSLEAMPAE